MHRYSLASLCDSHARRLRQRKILGAGRRAEQQRSSRDPGSAREGVPVDAAAQRQLAGADLGQIDRADAVLAVTDDDKTNLLVAVRAKQAGCPMAIALVNDPTLVPLMGALDIDAFINPRATTVSSILRHIRHGRVRAIYSIGDAEAEVIEAQVLSTSPLAGRLIRDTEFPEGVLVGAVMKGDKVFKPTGDLRMEEGDVIALFAMSKDVREVERLLQVSVDFF